MSKALDKTHLDEVLRVADKKLITRCKELLSNSSMSAAFVSLLERIGQENAGASVKVTHQQFGLAVRFLFSCLIDADRIDSADFERGLAFGRRHANELKRHDCDGGDLAQQSRAWHCQRH